MEGTEFFYGGRRARHAQCESHSLAWQKGQAMYRPRSHRNEGDRNDRRSSTAPAGRTAYHRGQRGSRSPGRRYRTGTRSWDSPPQSALRVLGRAAKEGGHNGKVVDDFPEQLPVLPAELKVIETYLAQLVDESQGAEILDTTSSGSETTKRDVE
jgi:hypothetical protein